MNSPAQLTSERALPLPGNGQCWIAADWRSIFENAGLRRLEDFFSISGKALSKPGLGKRYRAQLDLKRGSDTVTVFYKRYEGESSRAVLQRWLEDGERNAIASREVNVAEALKKIQIATFQPLAWGWTNDPGPQQKSFLIMSRVPGDSLERWLPAANLTWQRKLALVEQLARLAKRLHASGWFHRDFYLCHIFIEEVGHGYELALVDLARMFRPRWRVRRWQIKDLAQLHYSAGEKQVSRSLRLRFAKKYFEVDRLTAEQKTLLRQIVRRAENIRQRDQKKAALQSGK